jgi:hypothetical protein
MAGETFRIDMITESTAERLAAAMESNADATMRVANKMGAYDPPRSWPEFQQYIRSGQIEQICPVGSKIQVDKESSVSTTIVGGITAATVDEDTFISAVGHAGTAAYEFTFDGAAWLHEGHEVELSLYGIQVTGTPNEHDMVVVHVQADKIEFTAVGINYDVPVNKSLKNSISFWTSTLLLYGSIPFCAAQKLVSVREALPAGTYNITLDHASYGGGTAQDGTYQFTTTQPIPAGGGIRHSSMGAWQSGGYSKAQITAGTFTTYDASYNVIESGIVCTEGSGGTSLGTATANDPQYRTTDYINYTERNVYGSNRWLHSANRKWLRSDAPGASAGAIASWWYASDEFDMPVRSTLPGFLHGLDPAFREIIQPVRKRTAKCIADGYGYEDLEETVFLPSMTELAYGQNNSISETAANADGTLATTAAWDLYVGATNDDRIMCDAGGTPRYYWHRSPLPSDAGYERSCNPSGALYNNRANDTSGVGAGLVAG